jgi:hypothetical protein
MLDTQQDITLPGEPTMTRPPHHHIPLALAAAFTLSHGAADARGVTVSANGGPGGLFIASCGSLALSSAATDCIDLIQSNLSVDRTNVLMDVWSGMFGRTAWTDPFSGIVGPFGDPYTPFIERNDTQLGAGAGSDNALFDATAGLSADGTQLTGSLALLQAFNGPFILGVEGVVEGTEVSFSGLFLYSDSALAAGDRIDFALPNLRFTFPSGGGIGDAGGSVCFDEFGNPCPPPTPPSYAISLTRFTIFEDPGRAVPVSGTLGLALAGLALLGWSRRRQRAVAIAAR